MELAREKLSRCPATADLVRSEFGAGAHGRTERLLSRGAPLPAVLAEPGRVLVRPPTLPHAGLRLPATLLSPSVPAVLAAVLPEPGLGLLPPAGPLLLHQLPASAPAGGMALAEVALRGRGAAGSVSPRAEPGPPPGILGRAAAPARPRGGRCGPRGGSSGDAPGTSRLGGSAGEKFLFLLLKFDL